MTSSTSGSSSSSKASFTDEELKDMYDDFLIEFKKSYSDPQEKQRRFEIFKKRVRRIYRHNLTCQPWEKQGVNSSADAELEEICGFFMGAPPLSTPPVSIFPTFQLTDNFPAILGRTDETELSADTKELHDLLNACVKFHEDKKNQVVTQQDSSPKDEESALEDGLKERFEKFVVDFKKFYNNPEEKEKGFEIFKKTVMDIERHNLTCKPSERQKINFSADGELEQERANVAGLKRGNQLDEKESSLVDSKKPKLDVEEGKNDMQSKFLHMASTEQKTAYDDTLRLMEEPNKLEMEIEGLRGKIIANSVAEEQIKKINDELEAMIKREKEAAIRKVRQLIAEQQLPHLDKNDE